MHPCKSDQVLLILSFNCVHGLQIQRMPRDDLFHQNAPKISLLHRVTHQLSNSDETRHEKTAKRDSGAVQSGKGICSYIHLNNSEINFWIAKVLVRLVILAYISKAHFHMARHLFFFFFFFFLWRN